MIDDLVDLGTRRICRNFPMSVIVEAQAIMAADEGLRGLVALANWATNDGVVTPDDGVKALKRFTEGPEGEHAVFSGESKVTIDGDKVIVRTGELQTCLNCDRPEIVGGIVLILHEWILEARRGWIQANQLKVGGKSAEEARAAIRAKGYERGLRAFAWWKDGVQYVGTCGTTLKEAIKRGEWDG